MNLKWLPQCNAHIRNKIMKSLKKPAGGEGEVTGLKNVM